MSEIERIRHFLRAVRRRALIMAGLRAGSFTGVAILAVIVVLGLFAARVGPASFWPTVTIALLLLLTLGGLMLGWARPALRLRTEHAVARFVGQRHPPLASDLVSAVELAVAEGTPVPHGGSPGMTRAFHAAVADAVKPLDPRRLVPLAGAAKPALFLVATAVLVAAVWFLAPTTVRRGLRLLLHHPTRFEGAAIAHEPLMGEVRITYSYPAYTKLPQRVVEGSTGDMVAIKGTKVVLETKALRSAREAMLLFGDAGERGEKAARLEGGKIIAELVLHENTSYRVWLVPYIGRPVREARPHRIVAEVDRAPDVDIIGPADRLELPAPRPIEVAYSARDDFGLGPIDLVYRVEDGPEQRIALKNGDGAKNAQGKTVFEPGAASLRPGVRVAYRIEAKDRDGVSGAKAGSSRTLYVVIQSPRENLDEQLAREREILDRMIATLADRLELGDPVPPPPGTSPPPNPVGQLQGWMALHEGEEGSLTLLGRLVDEERRAGGSSKSLVTALAGIADRLGKHMRDEAALLAHLRPKADVGTLSTSHFAKVLTASAKHVPELEGAVLLLDDLIGRQRLEDLAALGRDLTNVYKRLQDLLGRYETTKDEALRRQIEREIRDLRARMEELARKIAEVKTRNEVPAEWQNMPEMKEALEKASRLDQLLEKGDSKSLQDALSDLGNTLESLQRMLDRNAEEFGGERFPQENRMASEMMKKLSDLEGDQRSLAGDAQGLTKEVEEEMARRVEQQKEQALALARQKADQLRKKLGATPPRDLGEVGTDELKRAQESAKSLRRHLQAKDWGEAKKEVERVGGNLKRVQRSLEDRAQWRRSPSPSADAFSSEMGEASKITQELASELDKLAPRPEDVMAPGQRERSRGLGQREGSIEQRARGLAEEMGKRAGQVPGADKADGELKNIAEQMNEAGRDFERGSAKEGTGKAREAAERLSKLRDSVGRRQMGRSQTHREPVRIPGADESKAPREWRQELLEAMREKAPERFREEVRKYYEELVK